MAEVMCVAEDARGSGVRVGEWKCPESVTVVDLLCCKICYEPYQEKGGKEPKIMKCGHTLCSQCVNMIYSKQRSTLLCPFCKSSDRTNPKNLPKNFDIVHMLPHYPNLPPSQKPHNVEFERIKYQWDVEQALVSQLRENSEQANHLVMQAMNQLNLLRNHADMAASRFQQAEGDMKASEDTLRLFIDLHPDDPRMKEVSELLPQPMVNKAAFSMLEEIRQGINLSRGNSSRSRQISLMEEIHSQSRPQESRVGPPSPPRSLLPPPPPPSISNNVHHRDTNSFARSIADAAARMQMLNNPPANQQNVEIELEQNVSPVSPPPPSLSTVGTINRNSTVRTEPPSTSSSLISSRQSLFRALGLARGSSN